MSDDLLEPATVQYNDWRGTFAADEADGERLEAYLGVKDGYRLMAVDITIYGGHQEVIAYGVPKGATYADLAALVASGEPIRVRPVAQIDMALPGHADTNPPPAPTMPVQSATELLAFAFKRVHLRLVTRNLPEGARLLIADEE